MEARQRRFGRRQCPAPDACGGVEVASALEDRWWSEQRRGAAPLFQQREEEERGEIGVVLEIYKSLGG